MEPEEAAAMIGRQFGLVVTAPVTLADSNNVVVWLAPSPVVAKIGTGHHRAGPIEWDLAHLGADAAATYEDVADSRVLALCTALVSVKTAAWCWARIEHPDLGWHATHHLAVVKNLMQE